MFSQSKVWCEQALIKVRFLELVRTVPGIVY
jgi:hypothetical protein